MFAHKLYIKITNLPRRCTWELSLSEDLDGAIVRRYACRVTFQDPCLIGIFGLRNEEKIQWKTAKVNSFLDVSREDRLVDKMTAETE